MEPPPDTPSDEPLFGLAVPPEERGERLRRYLRDAGVDDTPVFTEWADVVGDA